MKAKNAGLVLAATAVVMISALPSSAAIIYSSSTLAEGSYFSWGATVGWGYEAAVEFTPSSNYILDSIAFAAKCDPGGATTITIDLTEPSATGTPYASFTADLSIGSPTVVTKTFPAGTGPTLLADHTYWVVASGPSDLGGVWVNNSMTKIGDVWTKYSTYDWYYRATDFTPAIKIEGTLAPVPIPSTLLLMGSGLAGLLGIAKSKMKK